MSTTHKPFRELVNPNSNFEFVEKRRTWILISLLAISVSIGMLFVNQAVRGDMLNWSTDFKGGTELIFSFTDKDKKPVAVDAGTIRSAFSSAGKSGFAVSNFEWETTLEDGSKADVKGMLVRSPEFGAVSEAEQEKLADEFAKAFAQDQVLKTVWSGDRMHVRANSFISWERADEFFAKHNLKLREWDAKEDYSKAAEGTTEYNIQFAVRGLDAQYQQILQDAVGKDITVHIDNVYGVGARAGRKLRNDGIKSLFYAMALILLYLAIRFDIRYAPGAVIALLHDATLVIGAFAITWQEVSLTTVAALLTVIGYSVNDTVVIFDRIRENVERLKDKKFSRVINISLNETMSRTLLTSITLFVVTIMMNILGTGLIRNFAFAMNVGVVVGVYSSIFIASPIALAIHNRWYSGPSSAAK